MQWPIKTFTSFLNCLYRVLHTERLLVRVTRSPGPLLIMMLDIHVKESRLELSPLIRISQIDHAKVLSFGCFDSTQLLIGARGDLESDMPKTSGDHSN